ncbi:ThuA domain-containing protein [Celeribacter arenosi]|uniref:ThuA domain-containing protein n=1 Tax=Celeribacter arenosi TaxID=792649 RepID=A0ABP7JUU3_9RHOB
MAKALITWGGWDGHEPDKVAALCGEILTHAGFEVETVDHLDCFDDQARLEELDLIVPIWTMSSIEKNYVVNVSEAVARGVGLAGVHGGMCDAFRDQVLWQFMTGANWVSHPGGDGVKYTVNIANSSSPLVAGIRDFDVETEQYYLHVDPVNEVLATTRFPIETWYHSPNGPVDMPVAWTRRWGLGRVYYNALGHHADVIDHGPAREMLRRGLLWAAQGRKAALDAGERFEDYASEFKNF